MLSLSYMFCGIIGTHTFEPSVMVIMALFDAVTFTVGFALGKRV